MRKLWLVCCKELRMTATRAYLIVTLAGPLLILATIALPELLVRNRAA